MIFAIRSRCRSNRTWVSMSLFSLLHIRFCIHTSVGESFTPKSKFSRSHKSNSVISRSNPTYESIPKSYPSQIQRPSQIQYPYEFQNHNQVTSKVQVKFVVISKSNPKNKSNPKLYQLQIQITSQLQSQILHQFHVKSKLISKSISPEQDP